MVTPVDGMNLVTPPILKNLKNKTNTKAKTKQLVEQCTASGGNVHKQDKTADQYEDQTDPEDHTEFLTDHGKNKI